MPETEYIPEEKELLKPGGKCRFFIKNCFQFCEIFKHKQESSACVYHHPKPQVKRKINKIREKELKKRAIGFS